MTFIVVWSNMSLVIIWTWISWMNYRSVILEWRISLSMKLKIKLNNSLFSPLVFDLRHKMFNKYLHKPVANFERLLEVLENYLLQECFDEFDLATF